MCGRMTRTTTHKIMSEWDSAVNNSSSCVVVVMVVVVVERFTVDVKLKNKAMRWSFSFYKLHWQPEKSAKINVFHC